LFRSVLASYEFWGYADMDMLMGRLDKLLPMDTLRQHDIVSVTFGDPYILYLRGQLTVHHNLPHINQLERLCAQFTNISSRLRAYDESDGGKWPFQSAEGCYSHAVLKRSNVSVLLATVQASDAFNARTELREAFMLGKAVVQCHEHPIPTNLIDSPAFGKFMLEDTFEERRNSSELGLTPVTTQRYKCIYRNWFDKKYEVMIKYSIDCIMRVSMCHTVMSTDVPGRAAGAGGCACQP